jgi:hypothetical protein
MPQQGPTVTVHRSCDGCEYDSSERDYDPEADEVIGWIHTCGHPEAKEGNCCRYSSRTPEWCPFLKEVK